MQCTSNIPLYYHRARELNAGTSGFAWHPYNGDANYGEERGCNLSVPPCNTDLYLGYQKGVLRQIMQNHEATFRYQVGELHRLYRRQRELVDGLRAGEFIPQYQSQMSESNYSLSQAQYAISQSKPSWILGDCSDSKLSVLTSESIQQPPTFIAQNFLEPGSSLMRENIYNEVKLLPSKSKGYKKRIFDLELPADMYHDGEEAEQFEKINFFIDLNEPFETHKNHSEIIQNEVGPESVKLEYSEVVNCSFDLNYVPENCLPEETEIEITKFEIIDLNVDLNCLNVGIECAEETGLEGPVSPENKESSPPRGDSEEIQPMEMDTIAAETLIKLSCGAHECSNENAFICLCWFAEIVSSAGDDLENERKKLQNQQHKVVRTEFLLALASPFNNLQTGLRKKGRSSSLVKRRKFSKLSSSDDVKKSVSSILKQPATRSGSVLGVLHGWGKVKKRKGVCRRPAGKLMSFTASLEME